MNYHRNIKIEFKNKDNNEKLLISGYNIKNKIIINELDLTLLNKNKEEIESIYNDYITKLNNNGNIYQLSLLMLDINNIDIKNNENLIFSFLSNSINFLKISLDHNVLKIENKFIKDIEQGENGETIYNDVSYKDIIFSQNFIKEFHEYIFDNKHKLFINGDKLEKIEIKKILGYQIIDNINSILKLIHLYIIKY